MTWRTATAKVNTGGGGVGGRGGGAAATAALLLAPGFGAARGKGSGWAGAATADGGGGGCGWRSDSAVLTRKRPVFVTRTAPAWLPARRMHTRMSDAWRGCSSRTVPRARRRPAGWQAHGLCITTP